jgi:hypothetical protein
MYSNRASSSGQRSGDEIKNKTLLKLKKTFASMTKKEIVIE